MNCNDSFGRLTVIRLDGPAHVIAACSCGSAARRYRKQSLRSGNTKSCGCLARERQSEVGRNSATHGLTKTPEHRTWTRMRRRCNAPQDKSFSHYGGRGITVCERWDRFEEFLADMGPRPSPRHSIDRIDNDKGYSPENCRWATKQEQTRNRRISVNVSFAGRTMPLQDWCSAYGADYSTVHSRVFKHGWPFELAMFAPKHKRLSDWAQIAWVADDFPLPGSDAKDETLTWLKDKVDA